MEEKRTILAFVLIGLILLLMPYYYDLTGVAPVAPRPPEEAEQRDRPADVEREPIAKEAPLAEGLIPPASIPQVREPGLTQQEESESFSSSQEDEFVPSQIRVTTPLQELVFSSYGGSLTSARLLNFERDKGEFVELVRPGSGQLTVMVRSELSERELDLSNVEFAADQESIRLQSGQTAQLRMVADLGAGRKVEKLFRFDADRYAFDLNII